MNFVFYDNVPGYLQTIITQAAGAWEGVMQSIGQSQVTVRTYNTGPAAPPNSIPVYLDDAIEAYAEYRSVNGERRLQINSASFGQSDDYLRRLFSHEIGHSLGQQPGTCDAWQSVSVAVTPAQFSSAMPLFPAPDDGCNVDRWFNPTGGGDTGGPGCRVGDNCSPLIVHLEPGPFRFTSLDVPFDFFGNGEPRLFSWPRPGSRDVFIVLDRNGNGTIDSGRELFGSETPLGWAEEGARAADGFAALSWFDDEAQGGNGDGRIDYRDRVYSLLRVWRDVNHNGISEQDELADLTTAGILSISLQYSSNGRVDQEGNLFRYHSRVIVVDGSRLRVRQLYDVFLKNDGLR